MDMAAAAKRQHLYIGMLYRKRMVVGEKDLGFIKIENTTDQTVTVWNNTLLKDSRQGMRLIVGVKNPYKQDPKGIVIQILHGKSPEIVERLSKVSAYLFLFTSRSMLIFCCYHGYYH